MKSNGKKKVLILYNKLFHYRLPIFNLLAKKYDLTVAYSYQTSEKIVSQCDFKILFLPVKKIWKFTIHKNDIFKLCNSFDVVIAYGDTAWLSYSFLVFKRNRKFKLLFWSIGTPASYNRKFGDAGKLHYLITDYFDKRADGLILYSSVPIKMYEKRGVKKQKYFVANNTVRVKKIQFKKEEKNNILFIGTLYLEKGLDILLKSYLAVYKEDSSIPNLEIVGGGEQFGYIQKWIFENKLENKVFLLGPVYDEEQKSKIFEKSVACISPLQAGLSVLESMGYGVPFITMADAITGGEIFNIINKQNGLKLTHISEFKTILHDITKQRIKYLEMGEQAYKYYWEFRKPEDMTEGIIEAIENV